MQKSRHFDEIYQANGQSPNYDGVVPYIGSSLYHTRSVAKSTSNPAHFGH